MPITAPGEPKGAIELLARELEGEDCGRTDMTCLLLRLHRLSARLARRLTHLRPLFCRRHDGSHHASLAFATAASCTWAMPSISLIVASIVVGASPLVGTG